MLFLVPREKFWQKKVDEWDLDSAEEAKKSSPWIGYASTASQLAIVVLSASILAVSVAMFWGSFVVAGVGILLSLNGLYLWF